ncbi:MAG TPA: 16S rRNA (guanine(966)-N(2))-methyltransferase RsmD [Deltaproteobacteria bacterium]|nr:MAG: 16S rRNA (guanine(966)-N(2))-methyltransferase RsmD [Deltaproteobacteria bacterium GWA2_45_12]HBF11982.1 16S rRNA (guanine(966)-N(2))-methyltransferase RsmD [Deltaproteobacteria bacterium]
MRIITGTAKGRRLFTPKSHLIRPAADKVKGSTFNILGSIEGLDVLDLFAGTGSVGLEAASRGAKNIVLVDSLPEALKLLEKNKTACEFGGHVVIWKGTLPHCLASISKKHPRFDLVFIDPPYDKGLIFPALEGVLRNKLVDAQSLVIIEHSPREIPEHPGFKQTDHRKYGQTWVTYLQTKDINEKSTV